MSYNDILILDVGGTRFKTSRQTLMKEPGSALGRMFNIESALKPAQIQDGAYFLDRDPKRFELILNYLRDDELIELSKNDLLSLKIEARYFQLTALESKITERLDSLEVYTFKCNEECVEVRKSFFRKVPFNAIWKVMLGKTGINNSFWVADKHIKVRDTEILLDNADLPIPRFCLESNIKFVRDHLVLFDEYIRVNAAHINFNICGQIFQVKTSAALRDPDSAFSRCWYSDHIEGRSVCPTLTLDNEANLLFENVCVCHEETCIAVNLEGHFPIITEKKMILESLAQLETRNLVPYQVEEEDDLTNNILKYLLFLSEYNQLV